ncbi:hypothetical protein [Defluviimonas salinarum]|uniref:Uncharacterized protein n=1 Tax=Defluviimonas salinarum TaxID=2992147 RepID=A0ABT3J4J5_9RHOB|nr:hypothetical protein [Defluviimonas salinarum]MCW3782616.1 hypothetical protein [Defluviimonas salinarum]
MVDLLQIINNVVNAITPGGGGGGLSGLLYILSYMMGVGFVIVAIKGSAKRSELGKSAGSWSQPGWTFVIGVCFIALPGLVESLTQTIFGQSDRPAPESIFSYAPSTIGLLDADSPGRTMIVGIVTIIQFVGLVAVMRGLFLLNQSAQGSGGPKTFGPGLTFVIAGVMAVNFPLFVGVIENLITAGSAD